jgi:hypothetical protein
LKVEKDTKMISFLFPSLPFPLSLALT